MISNNYETFEKFILLFYDYEIIWTHRLFWPQWFFIMDNENKLKVDLLGRFEELDASYKLIMNELGLHSSLKKRYTSSQSV